MGVLGKDKNFYNLSIPGGRSLFNGDNFKPRGEPPNIASHHSPKREFTNLTFYTPKTSESKDILEDEDDIDKDMQALEEEELRIKELEEKKSRELAEKKEKELQEKQLKEKDERIREKHWREMPEGKELRI